MKVQVLEENHRLQLAVEEYKKTAPKVSGELASKLAEMRAMKRRTEEKLAEVQARKHCAGLLLRPARNDILRIRTCNHTV